MSSSLVAKANARKVVHEKVTFSPPVFIDFGVSSAAPASVQIPNMLQGAVFGYIESPKKRIEAPSRDD